MADNSGITWTDASWNPTTGCAKVSAGCKNCYALREWPRNAAQAGSVYEGRAFTDVMTHPERLDQPLRWRRARKIFVNATSDLFHDAVPTEFIDDVFAIMGLSYVMDREHVFQVLTKRTERMHAYLSDPETVHRVTRAMKRLGPKGGLAGENSPPAWPLPNVWLGVTVEDQAAANERIPVLLATPAAVHWVSMEPMLGAVDLTRIDMTRRIGSTAWLDALSGSVWIPGNCGESSRTIGARARLDWVVLGGESGPDARPMHPHWVRTVRDACLAAGVAFLFKQWGEWVPRSDCYHTFEDGKSCVDYDPGATRWPCIRLTGRGNNGRNLAHAGDGDDAYMQRVGARMAGRLLEGMLHDAYPAAA